MGRQSSIDDLPEEVRRWLERALTDGNFSGYKVLEDLLHEKGFVVSKSAIHRFGQKMERRFAAVKASTEAARILVEGSSDEADNLSGAVISLVQSGLFESIVNLQEATDEEVTLADRIGLLSSAAKNIATVSRASVHVKRYQAEIRVSERTRAAEIAVKEVKAAGLSDAAAEVINQKILGTT